MAIAVDQSSVETLCTVERMENGLWVPICQGHNALTDAHRQMYAEFIGGASPSRPTTIYAGLGAKLIETAYAQSTVINLNTTAGLDVGAGIILGEGTVKVFRAVIEGISGSLVTLSTPLQDTYDTDGTENSVVVEPSTVGSSLQQRVGDPVTVAATVFNSFWGRLSGTFPAGQPPIPSGQLEVRIREMGLFDGQYTGGNTPRMISRVLVNYIKRATDSYRVEFRSRLLP